MAGMTQFVVYYCARTDDQYDDRETESPNSFLMMHWQNWSYWLLHCQDLTDKEEFTPCTYGFSTRSGYLERQLTQIQQKLETSLSVERLQITHRGFPVFVIMDGLPLLTSKTQARAVWDHILPLSPLPPHGYGRERGLQRAWYPDNLFPMTRGSIVALRCGKGPVLPAPSWYGLIPCG